MSDHPPSDPNIDRTEPEPNAPTGAAPRPSDPRPPCGICGAPLPRPAEPHLRTHGLSAAQYARVFDPAQPPGPPTSGPHAPPQGASAPSQPTGEPTADAHASAYRTAEDATEPSASGAPHALLARLADACAESPAFLDRVADDVGQHLLSGRVRGLLAGSLGALIATRTRQAGDAAARLDAISRELSEPWRVQQGGEAGGPTPTSDLVKMSQALQQELNSATDAVTKAAKLAIDERRGERGEAAGDAPLDRYTGALDEQALPPDVGPGERAIMLALIERMAGRALRDRTMLDAATSEPEGGEPSETSDSP